MVKTAPSGIVPSPVNTAEKRGSVESGTSLATIAYAPSCILDPVSRLQQGTWGGSRNRADRVSRVRMTEVKKLILQHHGSCPVRLVMHFDNRGEVDIEIPGDFTVMPSRAFTSAVAERLGYAAVNYQTKTPQLVERKSKGNWQKKE